MLALGGGGRTVVLVTKSDGDSDFEITNESEIREDSFVSVFVSTLEQADIRMLIQIAPSKTGQFLYFMACLGNVTGEL